MTDKTDVKKNDQAEPQVNKNAKAQGVRRKLPSGSASIVKSRTGYVSLNVLPADLWLKVRRGDTIWEALQETDIDLDGDCGGLGKCGKCKVRVMSAIGPPSGEEIELLSEEELSRGIRLACRTEVADDMVINTVESGEGVEYYQILKTGHRPLMHPFPLVGKRLITLPPDLNNEGLSDLDRIKLVMMPEYQDISAPLSCLRDLPDKLRETGYSGAAVLHENCLLAWQDQSEINCYYGMVYDLGTSTIVAKLISLVDGSEVAVVSCLNSQMKYGTNVISRLQYVKEHRNGLKDFHNLLVGDLNHLTARVLKAAGLKARDIFIAVAAGNTTMQHLLLTLSPLGIAEAPFSPVLTDGLVVKAADVGLKLHPEAMFYIMPTKSGYIGGDLISVILASGAAEQDDEIVLGLDLGTNGEIFLGNSRRLMTCSAAAGPALEGANISHGMIAEAGAIESASISNGLLCYRVIGNIRPLGICGSGLVDLIAILLHNGNITRDGLITLNGNRPDDALSCRIFERDGVCGFLVAAEDESHNGEPVYLTQRDVRELQLAKGAIAAGVKTLMDEMGIGIHDIRHVYLAGALGNYIHPLSAVRTGIIPGFDPANIVPIGNAASAGASMVLLSRNYWKMANELSDRIEHIELSSRIDFNQHFIEQIDFPEDNMW